MQIRVGYELLYTFPQPTPMILTLNVHYSRANDIVLPDVMKTEPAIPTRGYRDGFGNWCTRLVAPAGSLGIPSEAIVNDSGAADVVAHWTQEVPADALPDDTLVYLLGSRYCETDKLSEVAWSLFGNTPPGWGRASDLRLRPTSTCPVRLRVREPDQDRHGHLQGGSWRLPRLRSSSAHPVPLHEHPGALPHRLPGRYRHSPGRCSHGFSGMVRGYLGQCGTPSIRATTSRASAGC